MTRRALTASCLLCAVLLLGCKQKKEAATVKVGILHSLTGEMAMSESPLCDAELLAIKQINEAGGVLGKQIEVIVEDGSSNPATFAQKAQKLLQEDGVATIFGCWTSASRKAVKEVVEKEFALLWYPVQYEGMEASPNIMYTGASPNQQVVPAIDYCAQNFGSRMYFVGSDYVFPQTAEKIIKAQLAYIGGECVGESFFPMEQQDFEQVIEDIKQKKPDVILNALNGSSNIYFFSQLAAAGISADIIPVMSFSCAEEEIAQIGVQNLKGNYVAWNYYQTTDTDLNREFVKAYQTEYGSDRVTSDPIEAAFVSVYLWAATCEKALSFNVEDIRMASKGFTFSAPEGDITIDGTNQHLYRQVRIGKINDSGLIDEIWTTSGAIKPDPYLSTYEWARGLK